MSSKGSVSMSGDESMLLTKAILLYGTANNSSYATIHDIRIDKKNGSPNLLQGDPLSHSALAEIMRDLSQSVQIGAFLPPHILSVGHNSVVWWMKPSKRMTFFHCNGDDRCIGKESAVIPTPALVFGVNESGWYVFALKGDERPQADTPLYQCPYFNVSLNGAICIGTTDIPKDYSADSTVLWDKAFFDSAFSHPNVHHPAKLVEFKSGSYRFWRSMLDGKWKKRFPEQVLVPKEKTVGDFIEAVNQERSI